MDPEVEGGVPKLKAEAGGGFEPKRLMVVLDSVCLAVLSVGFEVDVAKDPAGGNEKGFEEVFAEGKENGEDNDLPLSSFGVNPPPVTVEDSASFAPKPENDEGGVGMEKEPTLAVEREVRLDLLSFLDFSSYSFCTLARNVLYRSRRKETSANESLSTDFVMAVSIEAFSPRRDL